LLFDYRYGREDIVVRCYAIALALIGLIVACSPQESDLQVEPLPTLFPTSTPEYNNLINAEEVASTFLFYWQINDYEGMYDLISFSSQQATPYESFLAIYQNTNSEIRLNTLSYQFQTQARESESVTVFLYDVTFESAIVGEFKDTGREMRLLLDDNLKSWRVAWSPADIFAEMGRGAILRMETFTPNRANIYDRNGAILADMNGRIVTVNVIPGEIPSPGQCIATLSQALQKPLDEIEQKLATFSAEQLGEIGVLEPAGYVQWQDTLENECAAQFDNRPTRRYINGELAPHIIGSVGYPDEDQIPELEAAGFEQDSIIGKSGIEASWDETLRGHPGGQLSLNTPDGERLRLLASSGSQPSQSVFLTIDSELQAFTLQTIREAYANAANGWVPGSRGASAVIMDVNTGAILAMVSYPTYNANAFTPFPVIGREEADRIIEQTQSDPRRPLLNRAAQGRYPTGSTMKVVTAIAALDSGVYTADERYVSTGVWNRDIPRVDWLGGGHGSVTLADALTVSCNTCFYEAGYRLNEADPYLFPTYANLLGLGVPTGLNDIETSSGLIGTPEFKASVDPVSWSFSDTVNMAVGQGFVEVSPLQLSRVYAAIANGGLMYRPQLVDRIGLLDEFSYNMTPDLMADTGISDDVITTIRTGICAVTTERRGTAEFVFRNSQLQDIGVCAKTGTATSAGEGTLPHAWFAAYAPRANPQIVVMTMVENGGEGSEVAAPITRRILEYYFFERPSGT
jgi:penicillin-binding protein 2